MRHAHDHFRVPAHQITGESKMKKQLQDLKDQRQTWQVPAQNGATAKITLFAAAAATIAGGIAEQLHTPFCNRVIELCQPDSAIPPDEAPEHSPRGPAPSRVPTITVAGSTSAVAASTIMSIDGRNSSIHIGGISFNPKAPQPGGIITSSTSAALGGWATIPISIAPPPPILWRAPPWPPEIFSPPSSLKKST
jgi:hypothetical protein